MMDNATSNDTLIAALERLHHNEGLPFNATQARLRCMPHTIHLSALKVTLFVFIIEFMVIYILPAFGRSWCIQETGPVKEG
jgi:hypothetical protein